MRVKRDPPIETQALVPAAYAETQPTSIVPYGTQPTFELDGAGISRGLAEDIQIADLLAKSGYFSNVKNVAEAFTKLRLGRELGVGQVTALRELYLVNNKLAMSSALMAALIQKSGVYDFRVERLDLDGCSIAFFKSGEFIGRSEFTMADAHKAGLDGKDVWKKYPKNMLWSRALANGARWFCSGIFLGSTYTTEELDTEE